MDVEGIDGVDERWRAQPVAGRLRPWIEWFGIGRLVGTALAAVLVVAGGWWLLRTPAPPTEARLPYAAATTTAPGSPSAGVTSAATSTSVPAAIVVHVAGAVTAPGVYALEPGARVVDAVAAAGGALPEAEPAALNLAAVVVDGERVYVVRRGETPPPAPPAAAGPPGSAAPAGPIDVNRATVAELDELPGVGPATATAIVAHRDEHGPFASVDDLEAVPGIGPAKLAAIRDLVTT